MSFLWGRPKAAAQPATPSGTEPQATKQSGKAQSLELVKYHAQTGKFEVGTEALRILRATAGPVGVVSVCGRARQGKSYILNQLLGRAGGFTVGPTHRPCTKGLWVWSAPVPRTAADGSPYHLVLLDTEGIDAYDQTGQYSTQIFSLAVLLSSLFVFNQMGGIDEAALDRLSLVTEMTKHIRVRAGGGEDASELAAFTPSFLWLLRDFYLTLEEDGRSLFPDRDCFTLVRPVNEERELVSLDGLRPGDLRPEFREGLARLSALVFARARPKRLDSTVVTGPLLAGLVEAYVEAINAGAVPTIATAWQGAAAEAFAARALGPDAVKAANERRWREAVQARFAKARKEALASAALAVEQCLAAATKRELEAQAAGAEAALHAERSRSAAAAVAASQAQAHAFASPIPPSPPPAAGGAGRFAGARTVPSTPSAVEVKKMTKVAMQQWLTDAGEGATVYSLGLKNAKKAEYEAAVLDVLGSV
ncbi:Interferon-induced guanylate-binding protein 1 [Auxenochlorella protothecoides]|uniref:Interferon-induced guanylate-binding protein 1 n=1 Tax=Auxenochlorella protothecoides TaxID=3075 RepID=A0A087SAJ7_AUXPR|nr:Interferon-induced guanylate-binding protein 1 [Auxenochlorella protothecoides]KFM22751.1 Interferon-induced guanylate-binding protein 1 [Auxenochlorella protothecoides]